MATKKTDKQFADLLEEAGNDKNVIGFMLGGSRGKGFENKLSDYDPKMVVKDEVAKEYQEKYEKIDFEEIDLVVQSLSEFKEYAKWGTDNEWDRYDYTHVKALIDKTGEIQKLIDDKGSISGDKKKEFIEYSLDGYVNGVYRSVKCFRNNNELGAHLEASCSIPYLLDVIFALHERIKPFFGYLERELNKFPLDKLPMPSNEFLSDMSKILSTADMKTQQKMLKTIKDVFSKEGFAHVFEGWEGKDDWTINFKH